MVKRIADGVKVGSPEHARLAKDVEKEMENMFRYIGLRRQETSIWEMPKRYGGFAYTAPRGSFWHL